MCAWLLLLFGCREALGPDRAALEPRAPRAWAEVLAEVVDDQGDVDYEALREEQATLEDFLRWIGRDHALKGRTGQQPHAFWLNAWSALVLYQVLERDVQESVLEVPSALPWEGSRFFAGTEFVVAGEPMTLWELGHERLTHTNQDYQDFFALPVAARSGPLVAPFLFNATAVDAQLQSQTERFFASDRALHFTDEGELLFNPMFERYGYEFWLYTGAPNLCAVAAYHTTGERRERLRAASEAGCEHGWFAFDWSLNRAAK